MSAPEEKAKRHKKRMQARKKIVDEGVAKALEERGVVVLYTGDGKGKTTAAVGTVARALGYGYKVVVAQFIKGVWECGEKYLLTQLPEQRYRLEWHEMGTDFTWETQDYEADKAAARALWEKALAALRDESVYLVVLDELTYALNFHWLEKREVLEAIQGRPRGQTVIITGRGAKQYLRDIADTISEMRPVKHAFNDGIAARKGIEW
ncbi:cob(I)yrinic acid a,c-diamide adenosyltransferase [Microbulbifer thermotolerans]|uniref:Corrinoid adenosyltransferase n=1 Tax=Microbulbifer thermotolerans TaxID=252514 RepID=A0A143HNR1_MICTH|nr:cob(I)yrinic acid a,c-diamide adenosyltransferase [Microbulbifer thermotolerans]AMX03328.1 cob(I)yrinic acid a,c-diamide adenosyltransferase [Microbulbifer thermotolerans]MCX2780809.1 cob(I)yrinic acid a,c-diamide adenosyltransferase [Microbulbifer thermotolerans]MCX2784116.1 cob(I)yrinic acid a,c-diamide adenosyltransferase [Microbulbifer thermotolerans]MCX2794423.1 cob(I)yrinic acid a,c-diamide adenosyltransferase [Microbulbifer thermotolerans]MCX2801062.1 cob(I)yrinic acid a,c-diamide ad